MADIPQHTLTADVIDQAGSEFETSGCLILHDLLEPQHIRSLEREFRSRYESDSADAPSIQVGEGRRMVPIELRDRLNDPSIFASPDLMKLFGKLLGEKFILSVFSCVTSSPGAPVQHRHRDSVGLFNNPVDYFCPSFAINLFIPLVPLTEETGTTRMWPGTHRKAIRGEDAVEDGAVCPYVPAGSAMLMDYRLLHEGTANNSEISRPILCLAYTRNWFVDTHHFQDIDPINISQHEFERLSHEQQQLFGRHAQRLAG